MIRRIIVSGFFVACSTTAFSQDDTSSRSSDNERQALTIHGSADAYYRYDFAKQESGALTSFTQTHNRFELGMASVTMKYETSKTQVVLDLGFGKRAQDFSYTDAGNGALQAIKQAYISYTPTANFTLTAGSWATHIGYELLDAYQNRNYSMSYMFSTGPFSNTGIKAEYSAGKSSFMIGLTNPTDYKYVPDSVINRKFIIAQYHYDDGDKFNFYLNYTGGEWTDTSKVNQIDMVVTTHISPQFWIGVNSTLGLKKLWTGDAFSATKKWWGTALYLNGDISKCFGLTLREEYFSDKDAVTAIPIGGNVWASTLSCNLTAGNLTLIPEFRIDAASKPVFQKANGAPSKTDASLLLALAYHF